MKRKTRRLWVVKSGSNLICSGGPLLIRAWMDQVARLRRDHAVDVVWVTSGAIASALDRTRLRRKNTLGEKQALSAIGQPMVMGLYDMALHANGLLGAQILLTYDDLAHAKRRRNFQTTVRQLLGWGVTPILNENDAVSTEEIQFGDNDSLSAKVAIVTRADELVMLTDVDGLYGADPGLRPGARLITRLDRITEKTLRLASGVSRSGRGRGGMLSKLMAAAEAGKQRIPSWIIRGDRPNVLLEIARGNAQGTRVELR